MSLIDQAEVTYRQLVDATQPEIMAGTDLSSLYARFGLAEASSMDLGAVRKHLSSEIERHLDSGKFYLRDLKHQLLLRHFSEGAPISPYLELIERLMEGTRSHDWLAVHPDEAPTEWKDALQAAANQLALQPSTFRKDHKLLATLYERQYAVGTAVRTLRDKKYRVGIQGGRVQIEEHEMRRIARKVEDLIGEAGGLETAAAIFQDLRQRFDPKLERYHVVRRPTQLGGNAAPNLPVGYLLNLAIKSASAKPRSRPEKAASALQSAQELARAFAATFDMQPYNQWETMFHSGKRLVGFLREISVYDCMFTLKQSRPSDVERDIRAIFASVSREEATRSIGFTIGEAAVVARWIVKRARGVRGPFLFLAADLKAQTRLSSSVVDKVLAAYTHERLVNSDFCLPQEQHAVDFWFRPLLKNDAGYFCLVDGSLCAPAFYEAILAALRDSRASNLDSRIGETFENLVRAELSSHGVVFTFGEYVENGVAGECDLVIETDETIIFLELKKKALTRAARSGSDIDILYDLAESLLAAQAQLGRHECLLHQNGAITLSNGGSPYKLERRGRNVERVALSLLEFGALQDRNLISQILSTVVGFKFSATDPAQLRKMQAITKTCEDLGSQYQYLADLHNSRDASLFLNCWFLSLGHLRQILAGTTSNETFKKSLFATRHMVMSTFDFYFEHSQMLRIKENTS